MRHIHALTARSPTVAEAVLAQQHKLDGCVLGLSVALRPAVTSTAGQKPARASCKIFVGGLAQSVTRAVLHTHFACFGTLTDAVVMYDRVTQRSRGFGFLTFLDESAALAALEARSHHVIHSKVVDVKPAVPKEQAPLALSEPIQSACWLAAAPMPAATSMPVAMPLTNVYVPPSTLTTEAAYLHSTPLVFVPVPQCVSPYHMPAPFVL